jgi:hypothetical protein
LNEGYNHIQWGIPTWMLSVTRKSSFTNKKKIQLGAPTSVDGGSYAIIHSFLIQ